MTLTSPERVIDQLRSDFSQTSFPACVGRFQLRHRDENIKSEGFNSCITQDGVDFYVRPVIILPTVLFFFTRAGISAPMAERMKFPE